jgi:hypothetical protein
MDQDAASSGLGCTIIGNQRSLNDPTIWPLTLLGTRLANQRLDRQRRWARCAIVKISIAEIDVLHALTAPVSKGAPHPTIVLVQYLRTCTSISSYLCKGIADLADEDGNSPLQLRLVRRDTRHVSSKESIDRNVVAYRRVQELTDAIATDALCVDILGSLPGWKLKHQREYLFQRHGITEIRLRPGKRVSRNIAIKIAAFQINKSSQAVKKMIAAIEAINREA